jgi:hypothetical protein
MISTKVSSSSSGTNKIIQPGNVKSKINAVTLETVPYKEGAYHVCLHLETEPITDEGFEGLLVDKDDPNGRRYEGQVARIKTSEWAYSDGTTKSGIKVSRDTEIVRVIENICKQAGSSKWLEDHDNVFNTIEELVIAFNNDKPFKDKYMNFCIGAREYVNKAGYNSYDMHLIRPERGQLSFQSVDAESIKVPTFDGDKHIKKAKSESVSSFKSSSDSDFDVPTTSKVSADFNLD